MEGISNAVNSVMKFRVCSRTIILISKDEGRVYLVYSVTHDQTTGNSNKFNVFCSECQEAPIPVTLTVTLPQVIAFTYFP